MSQESNTAKLIFHNSLIFRRRAADYLLLTQAQKTFRQMHNINYKFEFIGFKEGKPSRNDRKRRSKISLTGHKLRQKHNGRHTHTHTHRHRSSHPCLLIQSGSGIGWQSGGLHRHQDKDQDRCLSPLGQGQHTAGLGAHTLNSYGWAEYQYIYLYPFHIHLNEIELNRREGYFIYVVVFWLLVQNVKILLSSKITPGSSLSCHSCF